MEMFDIVDEHGNPTGETVERATAHAEGIRHRTAHVWILRERDGKDQILLQKRCMMKDSFPGCYDISSAGHIPAGDDYAVSALRELKEELGVDASAEQLICCGDRATDRDTAFRGRPFRDVEYNRVFCLALDREEADFIPQPEEIESVLWMDLDQCVAAVNANTIPHCMWPDELDMVVRTWRARKSRRA